MWGKLKVQSKGSVEFEDIKNGYSAKITFDTVPKRPKDYFKGEIVKGDKVLSQILGSYMGFCDFDGVRYWSYDKVKPLKPLL